jgi:hypothetical protein
MHRPTFWFVTSLALACLAAISLPRLRADREKPVRSSPNVVQNSGEVQRRVATELPTIAAPVKPQGPVKSKGNAEPAKLPVAQSPQAVADVDTGATAVETAVDIAEDLSAMPALLDILPSTAIVEETLASNEVDNQPEPQPELPPEDSDEEIARLQRIVLASDRGDQPPAKLLDRSTVTNHPLRIEEHPALSPRLTELKQRLGSTLSYYRKWPVNTSNRSPWEVMHAAIAFGCQSELQRDSDNRKVTALGHLCFNGICEGDSLLRVIDGRVVPRRGPGLQGHDGQLLAILAQSKVKLDYPMAAYGRQFTIADLVENEKRSVRSGTELTFQLIGLVHYLRSAEETWQNAEGEEWSIRRMLREEINSPIRGAACGGTHRMMGVSYAIRKREKRGFKITGQYKRARKYTEDYQRYTFGLQNSDGSFSTDWFRGRAAEQDKDRRMQTTGHIFEWLAFSLSDEQLKSENMIRSAEYLTGLLSSNRHRNWKIGPLGHALHGLRIYQQRVLKTKPVEQTAAEPTRKSDRTALLPRRAGEVKPTVELQR